MNAINVRKSRSVVWAMGPSFAITVAGVAIGGQ
jgi:hypothetical protein